MASAVAGGDAICRVIRGLPATLLANAVMRDRHIVDTMAFCQKCRLDQFILRFFRLLRRGITPAAAQCRKRQDRPPWECRLLGGLGGDRQSHAAGSGPQGSAPELRCAAMPERPLLPLWPSGAPAGHVLQRLPAPRRHGTPAPAIRPAVRPRRPGAVNLPTDLLSSLTHLVPSLSAPVRCL